MSLLIRIALFAILAWLGCSFATAQSDPTAVDVKGIQSLFQAERDQALKGNFPKEIVARADELASRGDKALAGGHLASAMRYYRDARWQLPYLPPGLPEHVVRVFGDSRLRHSDRVNALSYNSDKTLLASCSRDGTVKVWDLGNGREVTTYRGHLDQPDDPTRGTTNKLGVSDVAFHPKKKLIASASGNQVHLWEPDTGKYVKTLFTLGRTEKPIKPIAFSPDGKYLAIGADDGILRVIEVETGKEQYKSPSRNTRIESLAYSPNGNMIVVGDNNTQIAIYAPAQTNQLVMTVPGIDLGGVQGVAFTPDNSAVVACGLDSKVRLTAGPKPDGTSAGNTTTKLREYIGHSGPVSALAITPDGNSLVTGGSEDSTIRVWELSSGKQLRLFQCYQKGKNKGVSALTVRGDGKQIASGSEDGSMRLWDLNAVDEHRAFTEASDSLWAVAASPDGKRVATAGGDKIIRIYNMETAKLEVSLPGAKSPITSLAFFPDSNRLAAAGGDQVVAIWDIARAKVIAKFQGHESAILTLAISDDGKWFVSGSADRTVRAFDPVGEKLLWTWTGRSAVCSVAVQHGNKFVALGLADGTLVILDVTGSVPKDISNQTSHVAGIACVAFSPNGERLASVGGDGILRLWTINENGTPALLHKFEGQVKTGVGGGPSPLTGVAFSPDNRFVATVGADSVVRVWDTFTRTESRSLRGHSDWVTAVSFSPDGRFLFSVGVEKDRALRVFELPQIETAYSGGHTPGVNAVAVSPDGKTVATAGTDQTIKLWEATTGKELSTLLGSADEIPFSLAYLGNDSLVLGVGLKETGRLHFWKTSTGRLVKTISTGEVYNVVSNADGSKVAAWVARPGVGDYKNFAYELFDSKGNQLSSLADKGRKVLAATFSADLLWAIAGDDKGNLLIWDLAAQKPVGDPWSPFTSAFLDVGITPNKKHLVAADDRGLVKVADIAKREIIGSLTPHKSGVRSIVISPAGTTFLTVGNDGEIKSWSLDPANLKEPKATRTWLLPVTVNGATYSPDGKQVATANADGTAYLLEMP